MSFLIRSRPCHCCSGKNTKNACAVLLGALLLNAISHLALAADVGGAFPALTSNSGLIKSKKSLGKFSRDEDPEVRVSKLLKDASHWLRPLEGLPPNKLLPLNGDFSVLFLPVEGDTGDFERYSAVFEPKSGIHKRLSAEPTGWAVISPDSKFIVLEPLTFIDVKAWKSFDLSRESRIPNYISIRRWSKDGKSLILSQTDCGLDCPKGESFEYW